MKGAVLGLSNRFLRTISSDIGSNAPARQSVPGFLHPDEKSDQEEKRKINKVHVKGQECKTCCSTILRSILFELHVNVAGFKISFLVALCLISSIS